jgi:hypothetical protein
MSAYTARLGAIRDEHRETDLLHRHRDAAERERWREARRQTYLRTLTEALGAGLDDLDTDEARTVEWLAGWDDDIVAGVAALLDRARHSQAVR